MDDEKEASEEQEGSEGEIESNVVSLIDRRQSKTKFYWLNSDAEEKTIIELDSLTGKVTTNSDLWFAANVLMQCCRGEILRQHGKTWGSASFYVYKTDTLIAKIGTDDYLFVDEKYIPDDLTRLFWEEVRNVQEFDAAHKTDETKDSWEDVALALGESLKEWFKLGKPAPQMAPSIYTDTDEALERLKKLEEDE